MALLIATLIGRYVPQLQRITLKFSKHGGISKGMRDFIQEDIVDFSRAVRCSKRICISTQNKLLTCLMQCAESVSRRVFEAATEADAIHGRRVR